MLLPTSLCLTAAAMLINFWLGMRCGKFRGSGGVSVGDGGNDMLMRRMRAQSNFIEQTPITLLGVALIELAGKGGMWLAPLGALFLIGRITHGIGMDGGFKLGRPLGMVTGLLLQLALVVTAVYAVLQAYRT